MVLRIERTSLTSTQLNKLIKADFTSYFRRRLGVLLPQKSHKETRKVSRDSTRTMENEYRRRLSHGVHKLPIFTYTCAASFLEYILLLYLH